MTVPHVVRQELRPARRSATALGLVVRLVRALPSSAQGAIMQRLAEGDLPDVPDLVRMLEVSGGLPDLRRPDAELLARSPELSAVEVSEPTVDGPAGRVPARLYRAPGVAASGSALVWVHGGAYVMGTLDMGEAHWVGLALAARGIPVLSLDYRKSLAGVHAPASADDVMAGWHWAAEHSNAWGVTSDRMHLGGASAGGNLAAGVAKRLRDGEGPRPASVVLAYPAVHPELPSLDPALAGAVRSAAGAVYFSPEWVADMALQHVGDVNALADPYAFAANGDVSGVPPTLILNCEIDTLRSSGEAYAEQLASSGVEVTVHLELGAPHGCLNEPFTDPGRITLNRIADWLIERGGQ